MTIKIADLTPRSSTLGELKDLTDSETIKIRGGAPVLIPIVVRGAAGAAGGALGQVLGNAATGQPLQNKVLESAGAGVLGAFVGPALGTTFKSIPVAAPLSSAGKNVIPASDVLRSVGAGGVTGLGNSLINK